jgi:hypothetical protein
VSSRCVVYNINKVEIPPNTTKFFTLDKTVHSIAIGSYLFIVPTDVQFYTIDV